MARESCPYVFCSAVVEMAWMRTHASNPEAKRLMVPSHDIQNPVLTGACPAGLMWIPLGENEVELLTQRAQADRRIIQAAIERTTEGSETDDRGRGGGVFPLTSYGPDGTPLRIGREPPVEGPERADWFPQRNPPEYHPAPEQGGYAVGNQGGRGMASIREVIGQVTEGNVKTGEALGAIAQSNEALDNCLAAIEQAKSLIGGALDGSGAQTLSEYAGLLEAAEQHVQSARSELEQALGDLSAGMERGEQAIGNLLG